jgi:hypothetical protein
MRVYGREVSAALAEGAGYAVRVPKMEIPFVVFCLLLQAQTDGYALALNYAAASRLGQRCFMRATSALRLL